MRNRARISDDRESERRVNTGRETPKGVGT